MHFIDFDPAANIQKEREPALDEAVLVVFPGEIRDIEKLVRDDAELEIVDRIEHGINDAILFYVRCEDEMVAHGLERAWTSFQYFTRNLKRGRGE